MAISRFKTSSVAQGLPKYQKLWDGTSGLSVRTNLKIWLDATAPETFSYSSSNVISQWADKSGYGNNATQGTTSFQPTLVTNVINGLPAVRFDGSDDFLRTPATPVNNSTNFSIFWVFNHRASDGDYNPFATPYADGNDRGSFHYVNPSNKGASYPMWQNWGSFDNSALTYSVGGKYEMEFHATGSNWYVYRDGTLDGQGTTGSVYSDLNYIEIARQYTPLRYSAFDIGEILVYSTSLSGNDRTNVRNYLKQKWGTA